MGGGDDAVSALARELNDVLDGESGFADREQTPFDGIFQMLGVFGDAHPSLGVGESSSDEFVDVPDRMARDLHGSGGNGGEKRK